MNQVITPLVRLFLDVVIPLYLLQLVQLSVSSSSSSAGAGAGAGAGCWLVATSSANILILLHDYCFLPEKFLWRYILFSTKKKTNETIRLIDRFIVN